MERFVTILRIGNTVHNGVVIRWNGKEIEKNHFRDEKSANSQKDKIYS